jgi:Protein of unknown function (DUF3047)
MLALALPGLAASAALAAVAPNLEAAGWRELANPNKAENTYSVGPDGAIEVASKNSVSTLYKPIRADIDARPILAWRWRVDEAAPATDLSRKGEDDCSLALYVGFPYESGEASFFERMKRPVVEAVAGEDAPGRVLRYVFCGAHEQGEVVPSPHLGSAGSMHVLRPGSSPSGTWFQERVDLAADFRAAFGTEPPDPSQIAIQADTDDTASSSRASVADINFLRADEAGSAAPRG